jgi:hypothetical protein
MRYISWRRQLRIAVMVALGAVAALADEQPRKPTSSVDSVKQRQRALAIRLLEEASAQAGSLEPGSQAALLFAVGETYSAFDKAKARDAFEAAYQNVRVSLDDHPQTVGFLFPELIERAVQVSPGLVEQSLPQGAFRDVALACLVKWYLQRKALTRATELLLNIESDANMTGPARDLIMALRGSPLDQRDRVFSAVLRAYKGSTHRQVGTGYPEDLGTLVVRFWGELSPALVHEAIDDLLSQARNGDDVVMSSPQGTVSFTAYRFRLFQVLPALQAIDPDETAALLNHEPEAASILEKYPAGQQTVDPWLRDTPAKMDEKRQTSYAYVHDGTATAPTITNMEIDRAVDSFAAQAEADAGSAVANAARIGDPTVRLRTLVGIARACAVKNPSAAKSALRQALASPPEDGRTWADLKESAEIARNLGDDNIAEAALKVGLKAARRLYDDDADLDNPNGALKLYWPSVRAYRQLITLQAKLSQDAALATIKNLPDLEVGGIEKVMLAAAWLNAPLSETSPMVVKRHNNPNAANR